MCAGERQRRVVLKLSGATLSGGGECPFDLGAVGYIAGQLCQAHAICRQMAVVVGGGNIIRGASFCTNGAGRLRADYAGMLATAVGAVFFVVSWPFSAMGDNVDEAGEKLVKAPARFTFERPLGEF